MSSLCMHSNRYDLRYPLLFSRSSRPLIGCKIDSILPLFPSETVNILYTHSLLEQVILSACWVSVAVDSERLTGHGPEQPTIVYPSLNGRVGLDELQRSIPTSMILWLYWLHAYHSSFTYLNNTMTCRPSHSSFCLMIFERLLLALKKDLDSANDHYLLCLYWVGAQSN